MSEAKQRAATFRLKDFQRISEANAEAMTRGVLSMWTVYDHPADHPEGFIARRFEVGKGQTTATTDTVSASSIIELRAMFDICGMFRLPRHDEDEPPIVETWL